MAENTEVLVVLGEVPDGKPHSCRFADADVDQVVKGAHIMNLHVLRLLDVELQQVAAELPAGKVLGSGKLFCPTVKRDLFDRFAALIGTDQELKPASDDVATLSSVEVEQRSPAISDQKASDPWSDIAPGSTVLATVGRQDGWWEAVVLAAEPTSEVLTLSWRDWPHMPSFRALRRSVGLPAPT